VVKKSITTPIGDIVRTVFEKLQREKTLTREEVEERWKNLVGDTGAKHTYPASLRKGTLVVFVDSSGWMQEMAFAKRKLLKQLKRTFGKDKILGIQFRIGEV
jgi:predicted nucleic acid-binding Zn ribbon protein